MEKVYVLPAMGTNTESKEICLVSLLVNDEFIERLRHAHKLMQDQPEYIEEITFQWPEMVFWNDDALFEELDAQADRSELSDPIYLISDQMPPDEWGTDLPTVYVQRNSFSVHDTNAWSDCVYDTQSMLEGKLDIPGKAKKLFERYSKMKAAAKSPEKG